MKFVPGDLDVAELAVARALQDLGRLERVGGGLRRLIFPHRRLRGRRGSPLRRPPHPRKNDLSVDLTQLLLLRAHAKRGFPREGGYITQERRIQVLCLSEDDSQE